MRVQLALDTGMHRLGIPAGDAEAIAALYRLPGLRVEGIFSHLGVSDSLTPEDEACTRRQAADLAAAAERLRQAGIDPGQVHLLASYGIWNYPEYHFDLVRAGIALYGVGSDDSPTRRALPLRPVLSLRARVAAVRLLAPGETAGYGRAFTAKRPTRLAVVAIGYADGLPRSLPRQGGRVLVRGVSCPMVGRMCMDQLLVDVTDAPGRRPRRHCHPAGHRRQRRHPRRGAGRPVRHHHQRAALPPGQPAGDRGTVNAIQRHGPPQNGWSMALYLYFRVFRRAGTRPGQVTKTGGPRRQTGRCAAHGTARRARRGPVPARKAAAPG